MKKENIKTEILILDTASNLDNLCKETFNDVSTKLKLVKHDCQRKDLWHFLMLGALPISFQDNETFQYIELKRDNVIIDLFFHIDIRDIYKFYKDLGVFNE
jgi:hypothetical protein